MNSNRMHEDQLNITPFSQDPFGGVSLDAKPIRNVIKRYWTEEEVRIVAL
jgi:hypothetical protein